MNASERKKLHEKIQKYLIDTPIVRKQGWCTPIAQKFGVNSEWVRDIYRKLRKAGKVEIVGVEEVPKEQKFKENVREGTGDLRMIIDKNIKTLEDLIRVCQIDTKEWNIDTWECNKWEVGAKNADSKIEVTQLFQVKAKLSKRKIDTDLDKQKEVVIEAIKTYSKPSEDSVGYELTDAMTRFTTESKKYALEINIPDLHIGKLAWKDETGEHYDLKIAVERYKKAVIELIGRTPAQDIDRYILVIGNDMLNVDGKHNMTTNGTPQSSDGRFYKMVQVAKKLIIETVDKLSFFAAVDIIVVPGNHDNNSMLLLGDVLEAWYHGDKNVNVVNGPTQRKYYQYGVNAFQYTHGNEEKHSELGMIFAAEQPRLWADTLYRVCKVGHYHKSKKIQYVSVDEFQGFRVQILPSLSGTDAWHSSKGYNSLKQAKAFLYHKEKGEMAEYTYTV